jgi:hypothetical protein
MLAFASPFAMTTIDPNSTTFHANRRKRLDDSADTPLSRTVAAMPVSPSFFVLLALVSDQAATSVMTTLAILACWLLWSWAAARLVTGIVIGRAHTAPNDISDHLASFYGAGVVGLGLVGVLLGGIML